MGIRPQRQALLEVRQSDPDAPPRRDGPIDVLLPALSGRRELKPGEHAGHDAIAAIAVEREGGLRLGADPIGINARDLSTFRIDRLAQLDLVSRGPRDRILIAESGIETRAQGAAAELAGAAAVLVGSTLMRAPDPAAKLAELISRPLVKVCGLTREEDVAVAVRQPDEQPCYFVLRGDGQGELPINTPRIRRGR